MKTTNIDREHILREIETIIASGLFDADFYNEAYPDVKASGMQAVNHYVLYGAQEGRLPRKDFDPQSYAKNYPESLGKNAFVDFIKRKSARQIDVAPPVSTETMAVTDLKSDQTLQIEKILDSGFFDRSFYLKSYPDVAASKVDPIHHYLHYGAVEFRNPSASFDTCWYWLMHQQDEQHALNPLIHYIDFQGCTKPSTKPTSKLELSNLDQACKLFISRKPNLDTCIKVAGYLEKIGRCANAELIYSHICSTSETTENLEKLARIYSIQKKWWQAADALQKACEISPKRKDLLTRRAEVCEKLNRLSDAVACYTEALNLEPGNHVWLYRLGYLNELLQDYDLAEDYYKKSIKLSKDPAVARFGIGVQHQSRGLWKEAAYQYVKKTGENPTDAELYYRIGMAYDRCFLWKEAAAHYKLAIGLDSKHTYWHYRLGFVLERAGEFLEAAQAYGSAANKSSKLEPYWFYRQGYTLKLAGNYEAACLAFLKSTKDTLSAPEPGANTENIDNLSGTQDEQKALIESLDRLYALNIIYAQAPFNLQLYTELAIELHKNKQWSQASKIFAELTARSNTHNPRWHYMLGHALTCMGEYAQACDAFEQTRIIKRAYGFDYSRYEKSHGLKNAIEYNELVETLPIEENFVFYESFHGASVSCNPYAIYKALSSAPEYNHLTHVWALTNINAAPDQLKKSKNVIIVERNSYLYRRYIATAKYLINNNTFMPWFVRRPEQVYLNTWHGTPMKGLGKDNKNSFMAHKNVSRNFLHATHLLSPNSHTSDVMVRSHDIGGTFSGIIAETGYPRNDRILIQDPLTRSSLIKRLRIDTSLPTVLYAPTWRGSTSEATVDLDQLISDLDALARLNCNFLFRGHHMSEQLIAEQGFKSVPADVETSDLLSIIDILITDYSSICFDFMPTGKPIIYYAYDYDEYRSTRGMYLDLETIPGEVVTTRTALLEKTEALLNREHTPLQISTENLKYYDSSAGCATERAIKLIFENDQSFIIDKYNDNRKSILIYAGSLPPNGITQSCLSLIHAIDKKRYNITLVIDPDTIETDQYRLNKLASISDEVQIVSRVGMVNYSPEEKLVMDTFNNHDTLHSEEMWGVFKKLMKKEFKRVFGCANFDVVIQFEGYGKFWTGLLGYGPENSKKVIYLHNNMMEEHLTKYEFLSGIFKLYPCYDKLISVSESVNQQNLLSLAEITKISEDKFVYCDNFINIEEIRIKSSKALDSDIIDWAGSSRVFGTVGRLSPEKGHYKLINAFYRFIQDTNADVKMIIVGDGPQWSRLQQRIVELGLEGRVLLAGIRENPYPLIKSLDLFVFSSDHEGQGLAIIEALVLNTPVISTDIPGPHSILSPGYGLLVENNENALTAAMKQHLATPLAFKEFIPEQYNKNVAVMFKRALGVPS
ncbi:CDP-glycerol glycerophosphotransferase family protein [Pseudomonas fulva]|uniref:CDP-glycerol glycerophosphotransferase family protein n=1 Tax=Pseudomonas fulva TaxID=47880 RepID=UPI002DB57B0A|nr:CDP-glycerol glycerophosphotransferase family protein [Pseudomonas fulva]MEC4023477.1 CDP-glycerol glycerophosphotransferase family protein [Pseudomonas fulva]